MTRTRESLVRVAELALASVLAQAEAHRAFPLQVDVQDVGGRPLCRFTVASFEDGRVQHEVLIHGISQQRASSLRMFPPAGNTLDLRVWTISLKGFREYEGGAVPEAAQKKRFGQFNGFRASA